MSRAWLLGLALACACNGDGLPDNWATAHRDDLVLGVEVTGSLKSEDSDLIGPPQLAERWDFKIARMAPEGKKVEQGDMVLAFDFTDLRQRLEQKQNEADSTATELEKRRADLSMAARDQDLALSEAEGQLRKARLKVDQPQDLVSMIELEEAKLDLALADKTVAYQQTRRKAAKRQSKYDLAYLKDKYQRADGRVKEIQMGMMKMMVKAPRSGTVIYETDWQGEKKKVGDSVWRGSKVLEIVNLDKMMAKGDVDEVDASKVAEGHKLTFKLDAHQDAEFTGQIKSIVKSVQRQSYKTPLKVIRVDITIDEVDPERMRPGMRFRGTIETGRVEDAVLIPVDALFVDDSGPVVFRRSGDGYETVSVELGQRNREYVEILSGISAGDVVSRSDLGGGES